jgi:hypothetical protein
MRRSIFIPILAISLMRAADAFACGGFFCSQTPVLQTAERIVFEVEGDEVTAYVQLQYQGNDPNFAWIVPVPDVPQVEVGVGQEMFSILEEQTKPVFIPPPGTSSSAPQTSAIADFGGGCGFGSFSGPPEMSLRYIPVPEVDVWKNEQVGPYDVVTLSAERAEDLNNWLSANGYRVVPNSDAIVQEYLDQGMKLLALKLSPTEGATAVEPIKMTYRDTRGCAAIPMKLTAIAAVPNLEIVTWVFGESRAAPRNYQLTEVSNEMLFAESDYPVQLESTVELEGGRAFVTEHASKSEKLLTYGNPILEGLIAKHGYVTRMRTYIDPDEMTADPEFDIDLVEGDVSREIQLREKPSRSSAGAFVLLTLATILILRRRS